MESGIRAGKVTDRIALIKKVLPQKHGQEINEVILEVIALTSREIEKNGISAQTQLAESRLRFRKIAFNCNKCFSLCLSTPSRR